MRRFATDARTANCAPRPAVQQRFSSFFVAFEVLRCSAPFQLKLIPKYVIFGTCFVCFSRTEAEQVSVSSRNLSDANFPNCQIRQITYCQFCQFASDAAFDRSFSAVDIRMYTVAKKVLRDGFTTLAHKLLDLNRGS